MNKPRDDRRQSEQDIYGWRGSLAGGPPASGVGVAVCTTAGSEYVEDFGPIVDGIPVGLLLGAAGAVTRSVRREGEASGVDPDQA
jgi:hypothetical protein